MKKGFLSVEFSGDGKNIASSGSDQKVKLWQLNGDLIRVFSGHNDSVSKVSFSPQGKTLVSVGGNEIKVWGIDGKLLSNFQGHRGLIFNVGFSPDGKIISSASFDSKVILWSLDLDELLERSCNWLDDYLISNPKRNDKQVCEKKLIKLKNYETF